MNFLLLGCSWAVPNYYGSPGDPPETHTEYLLRSHGHVVMNCGKNSGSNLQSLNRAKQYLTGEEISHPAVLTGEKVPHPDMSLTIKKDTKVKNIDWVICFQTDYPRDFKNVSSSGINRIETVARHTFQEYKEFIESLGSKFALIGGCMDLFPVYQEYVTPDFVVPSWSSVILGISPQHYKINDPELELQFMERQMHLQKFKTNSDLFPDGSHPGAVAHNQLVKDLLKCATNVNLLKH
jgi:hypothetical protein